MTRTGRTLAEYMDMGAAGLVALSHFVAHLPADSATVCEASGYDGMHSWSSHVRTNAMLADVYDNISALRYTLVASRSKRGKRPKRPKPYPRPWREDKGTKRFGKDAIPVSQFGDWWAEKVKEAERRG